MFWIRQIQSQCFWTEIAQTSPFLDENGCVGGQIRNVDLPFDVKHPTLLPKNNHLTNLIMYEAHYSAMHGGTQLTIRERYWAIDVKNQVAG